MTCPDCRHPNGPERNYCGACGAPLTRACDRCGFRNGVADRYCGGCGSALGEGARPPVAEAAPRRPGARPPPPPAGEDGGAADPLTAELLAVAAEAQRQPTPGETDPRVSQDDIDLLFGD